MTDGRSRFDTDVLTKAGKETTSDAAGNIHDLSGNPLSITETVSKPPDPPKFAGSDTNNSDHDWDGSGGDDYSCDGYDADIGGDGDGIVDTVLDFIGSLFS